MPPAPPRPGMLQEVFNLEEGPVTLMFPATLSGASYTDLADHLELFLRKAKRRAANIEREEHGQDPEGKRPPTEAAFNAYGSDLERILGSLTTNCSVVARP